MGSESKKWYASKTVWATIITVIIGGYIQVDSALGGSLPDVPGVAITLLGALGLYGRGVSNTKITL